MHVFVSVRTAVFMCVFTPEAINNYKCDVIWTLYDWLNEFYNFYMAVVVDIISRHGISIDACCTNQLNKSKLL